MACMFLLMYSIFTSKRVRNFLLKDTEGLENLEGARAPEFTCGY